MFDSSMVNEPLGFEPLKFFCICAEWSSLDTLWIANDLRFLQMDSKNYDRTVQMNTGAYVQRYSFSSVSHVMAFGIFVSFTLQQLIFSFHRLRDDRSR